MQHDALVSLTSKHSCTTNTSPQLQLLQVLPVELPGHGSRMKEPRFTSLCELSAQAVDALEPQLRWMEGVG